MSPSPCARKSTTRAPLNLAHAYGMETGAKGARIEASEGRVRRSRPNSGEIESLGYVIAMSSRGCYSPLSDSGCTRTDTGDRTKPTISVAFKNTA